MESIIHDGQISATVVGSMYYSTWRK